jgi:hypothetical protein
LHLLEVLVGKKSDMLNDGTIGDGETGVMQNLNFSFRGTRSKKE